MDSDVKSTQIVYLSRSKDTHVKTDLSKSNKY